MSAWHVIGWVAVALGSFVGIFIAALMPVYLSQKATEDERDGRDLHREFWPGAVASRKRGDHL